MKKIALSIVAVLAILAVSCSKKDGSASGASSGQDGEIKGELNVLWLAGMNQTRVIKDLVESDFVKLYPGLRVNMDESPNNEISQKALLEATSGVSTYDVVMQAGTLPQLANIDALYPIDDYIRRDNFDIRKMVDNGISFKGKYYGIPVRYDTFLLHYNDEQFATAGLDPDKPPANWEEFEDYGRKLTRDGHYGVSRGYGNNILAEAFVNTVYSLGGEICDADNNPIFNNETGVQALTIMMQELKTIKMVNPAATGWNYSEEIAGYLSGEAAMFIHYPARYIDAQMPEKSKIVGRSRVAPMFGENVLTKGSYALIFKTSKNKDAAWEFLKWLADKDVQKKVILNGGDCNPTNLDTLNDPELQEKYASLTAISGQFARAKTWPLVTQSEAIAQEMNRVFNQVTVGQKTERQALDEVATAARQLLIDSGELKP